MFPIWERGLPACNAQISRLEARAPKNLHLTELPRTRHTIFMRKILHWLALLSLASTSEAKPGRPQVTVIATRQAREDANKKLVLDFYQQFFGNKDITAADKYLLPTYIQHNPQAATGREAVKRFFKPFFADPKIPKTKIDVRHVAADGDLVWLHIRGVSSGKSQAVVDIFRVQNGKIAEHWDVIQDVPAKSANSNTMF